MKKILLIVACILVALCLTSCKKKKLVDSNYESYAIDYAVGAPISEGLLEFRVEKIGHDYLYVKKGMEYKYYFFHLNADNKYEYYVKSSSGWDLINVGVTAENEAEVKDWVGVSRFLEVSILSGHDFDKTDVYGDGYRKYREGGYDYFYSEEYNIFYEISSFNDGRFVQQFEPSLKSFIESPEF